MEAAGIAMAIVETALNNISGAKPVLYPAFSLWEQKLLKIVRGDAEANEVKAIAFFNSR